MTEKTTKTKKTTPEVHELVEICRFAGAIMAHNVHQAFLMSGIVTADDLRRATPDALRKASMILDDDQGVIPQLVDTAWSVRTCAACMDPAEDSAIREYSLRMLKALHEREVKDMECAGADAERNGVKAETDLEDFDEE